MTKSASEKKTLVSIATGFISCLAAFTLLTACNLESANSVSRTVGADVNGVYSYDSGECSNNGKFVSANTGAPVTSFDLRQTGDNLEAIDNNGIIFRGTIGVVFDDTASFTLEGNTTAGNSVTVSGTIEVGGGEGVMRATWIEDSLFGTVCGTANGPFVNTNTPSTNTNVVFRSEYEMMPDELAAYHQTALWFYEG